MKTMNDNTKNYGNKNDDDNDDDNDNNDKHRVGDAQQPFRVYNTIQR